MAVLAKKRTANRFAHAKLGGKVTLARQQKINALRSHVKMMASVYLIHYQQKDISATAMQATVAIVVKMLSHLQ
jgi:hypothetical protein